MRALRIRARGTGIAYTCTRATMMSSTMTTTTTRRRRKRRGWRRRRRMRHVRVKPLYRGNALNRSSALAILLARVLACARINRTLAHFRSSTLSPFSYSCPLASFNATSDRPCPRARARATSLSSYPSINGVSPAPYRVLKNRPRHI